MHKQKILPGILATVIYITIACGTISLPPQTETSSFQNTPRSYLQDTPTFYSTSTFQQTPAIPQHLPTPFATALTPSPEQEFGDSKISDNNGTVVFRDSFAHVNMNVQVQDSVTKDPIQQIEVQVIANGDNYLIVAFDPSGKYLPSVKSGLFSAKTNLLNIIHKSGSFLLNAIHQQGAEEIVYETLELVNRVDDIHSLQDLANLLKGFPSIEKWGIGYVDTCWSGKQLADAFSVGSGTLGLVLPISGAALTTTAYGDPSSGYEAGVQADMVLAATVGISAHLLTEDATAYLEALPGTYNFRIYYFPEPFIVRAIDFHGPCKNSSKFTDRIAFVSDRDGNPEIYLMEFAGPKIISINNLTKNLGLGINPAWPLAWSPDGKRIAFRPLTDNKTNIYVINSDGSGLTNLTNDPYNDSFPSWSPDGTHFSFTSNRDSDNVFNNNIYVMNSDGGAVARLTTDQSWKDNISWSPDSKHIAFLDNGTSVVVSVMNADGSELKTILENLSGVGSFSWSPDSTRIVFSAFNYGIGIVNADGSGLINLVSNSNEILDPLWSPDGKYIAFKSIEGSGTYAINLIRPDGSDRFVLTHEPFLFQTDCPSCPYLDFKYVWSPDSTRIAFESYRDNNMEIYIVNTDGSGLSNLTNNPAIDGNPVWSP